MATNRKLGRPSDQRKALLRGLVTEFVDKGKIETTETRAKEVRSIAEKLVTMAMSVCDDRVEVERKIQNDKGQTVEKTFTVDSPKRLHIRREVMRVLYDPKILRNQKESKADYKERTGAIKHPAVEKLMNELAPKYKKRAEESGQGGGYTRLLKMGPRRGDAAEMVILEFI